MSTHDNPAFTSSPDDVNVHVSNGHSANKDTIPPKPDASGVHIDTRFGYGPCKPRFLQIFNRLWFLTIFLTIFCFLEGFAINGIANAGLPAIERQFQLTSSKSSLIPASQDIGALVVIMFISFIGARHNKIVWIATGAVIMALGSFIFIIPHIVERYNYEDASSSSGPTDTCKGPGPQGGGPPCESKGVKWVGVFMVAQIVHGIGFTPMFTLGTTYLDENSNPQTAAMYVGICYAATAIGVAVGFFAGGQFMQKWFVEFDRVDVDTLGFDVMDSRWVGAWWLGFVVSTIAFVVIALPLFGYPKYMPTNSKAAETEAALQKHTDVTCMSQLKDVTLGFLKAWVRLAKNPTFIFISLGGCAVALIMFGVSAFSFKYLIEMYNIGFDSAGLLLGGLILFGSLGMFLGGLLIRIFKLEMVGMLRLNVVVCVISCAFGLAYMASCPDVKLAGLQLAYANESAINGYNATCNADCGCEKMNFNPVCGDDGLVYYSACHAGCLKPPPAPFEPYKNCTCVAQSLNKLAGNDTKATSGRCDQGCDKLKVLAPCLFIMMISILCATTPGSMATLRCVDEDIRPFALGVGWILLRLLGSIPGPVFLGAIIDGACKLWSGGGCGGATSCLLYDKNKLAVSVLIWWMVVAAVAALLFFIASIFASRLDREKYDVQNEKRKEIAT
ncbi:solute carrier organic anion transporter family member 4A1-like [Dreissena polymorpha]|uniref:Solute carrier organic anion transporter family member n=1 Tax=Dreissena polymorpha TaxID=45954 RepID=A0A9D4LAT9_DREPO|nr:solute carrier organic anion transporter family member 4A1-like [Dreissena polymorpha]KAH3854439.1 hypothetical protein DPMN_096981 [Dreissena polymorpha]